MASGCLSAKIQKWHQKFYTQHLHTRKILKNFKLEFLLESLAIRAPPAPCRIPIVVNDPNPAQDDEDD